MSWSGENHQRHRLSYCSRTITRITCRSGGPLQKWYQFHHRIDHRVGLGLADIDTVVVTVTHADNLKTGGTRRLHITHRIAQHQRLLRLYAEELCRMEQRARMGFLLRQSITTYHNGKAVIDAQVLEQRKGELCHLVGDAAQLVASALHHVEPLLHTGI